jgi:hypothetical protein
MRSEDSAAAISGKRAETYTAFEPSQSIYPHAPPLPEFPNPKVCIQIIESRKTSERISV